MPAPFATNIDCPLYAFSYNNGTGDTAFVLANTQCIVDSDDSTPLNGISTGMTIAFTGDVSTGSLEKELIDAVVSVITGKGYTLNSVQQYLGNPTDVTPT